MAYFLRVNSFPPLSQIVAVPQIVIIDQTGPAIVLGTSPGSACLVGEFIAGPVNVPTEVDSAGSVTGIFTDNGAGGGGTTYKYLSQDASSPPVQNGLQKNWEGNGMLQLLSKTFQRLVLCRVDHEAVTTDGGTTKGQLTLTVTVAAADQDGSSNTNKDLVIPAGTRCGSGNTFAGSTRVYATSGNTTIPKGTVVTTNTVQISVNCFPIVVVEPVVATASASIAFVLDPTIPNADPGTTITAVTNATALWPNGTGTTLAARIASMYPAAINATLPSTGATVDIQIIWAARRTQTIRQALANHAIAASSQGRGRVALASADPATAVTQTAAIAAIAAAVGLVATDNYVQPSDRMFVTFPQHQIQVPDFGNVAVTINGDGMLATTLANFAEEVNPGAANPYIQAIAAMEPAFVAYPLVKQDYVNLIAAGICVLYRDRSQGWQWMQGVTTANKAAWPTRVPMKRRRMADLIEDTIEQIASAFQKQPATIDRIDSMIGEIVTFLESLKSTNQPALQRIVDYSIDERGNTQALNSQGIYVFNVHVRTLASLDFPVFNCEIGETVTITQVESAAALPA